MGHAMRVLLQAVANGTMPVEAAWISVMREIDPPPYEPRTNDARVTPRERAHLREAQRVAEEAAAELADVRERYSMPRTDEALRDPFGEHDPGEECPQAGNLVCGCCYRWREARLAAKRARTETARTDDVTAGALEVAIALAEEGWSYASDYFREKWNYEERVALLRRIANVTPDEPLPTDWAEQIVSDWADTEDAASETGGTT